MSSFRYSYLPQIALCLGFFLVILDVTVVNVALPNLARGLHSNISGLQWVVDGYTLMFAGLLLSAGHLGDKLNPKNIFLIGLSVFLLASVGCGIADNLAMLTVSRLFQGSAAALMVPTSLTLIHASYPDQKQRSQAIGVWAAIGGIAGALGPILGGILTTTFSWRAVFFVNIPFCALAFILTLFYVVRPTTEIKKGHFDIGGQLLGTFSIGALAFGLIEAGKTGWLSFSVLLSLTLFLLALISFLLVENYSTSPMFPLNLFHSRTFSIAMMIGLIANFSIYGEFFILSLYFQEIKQYSPLITGFAFLPFLGLVTVSSYLSGKVTSHYGVKLPMFIGLFIGSIGFFSLIDLHANTHYFKMILPLACMGVGIAFCVPASTVAAMRAALAEKTGLASGAFNASRQIGSLLGVALFGTFIASASHFMDGMQLTLIIAGAFFLLGAIIVALDRMQN